MSTRPSVSPRGGAVSRACARRPPRGWLPQTAAAVPGGEPSKTVGQTCPESKPAACTAPCRTSGAYHGEQRRPGAALGMFQDSARLAQLTGGWCSVGRPDPAANSTPTLDRALAGDPALRSPRVRSGGALPLRARRVRHADSGGGRGAAAGPRPPGMVGIGCFAVFDPWSGTSLRRSIPRSPRK
jgi:hypothetical protein